MMGRRAVLVLVLGGAAGAVLAGEASADAETTRHTARPIPAFARQYRTSCSTCHTAAPKLNVLGEAFRLNGYRMPDTSLLIRRDEPLPLGDDIWRDEWPRAIWPGEIPGQPPIAFRVQLDAEWTEAQTPDAAGVTFQFPREIYVLAGTTLGSGVSTFIEAEWSPDEGIALPQAKLIFQNLVPGLKSQRVNLWVGQQNPYLFTFADRQIDRAARLKFRWQEIGPADLTLDDPGGGALVSDNAFRLGLTQPSVEMNGLLTERLYYGVGVGQGAGGLTADNNQRKDVYYKVRYKLGGLSLRGTYPKGSGPLTGAGGQLLDRAVIVEHFGYFGGEPVTGGAQDAHRSFGVSLRALAGRWDAGVGWVRSEYDRPWGDPALGSLTQSSVFGKVEWLGFPWLMTSLKVERFRQRAAAVGLVQNELRFMPGLVMLVRQNVRAVLEGELFAERAATLNSQTGVGLRFDFAF